MPSNSETFQFTVSGASTPQLVHPGDSTTETNTSAKLKGDGYYGRSDGLHTVQYNLTGFLGTIVVQATLAIEPAESDWFTVTDTSHSNLSDVDNDNGNNSHIYNFTGNFVWVRVYVSAWTDGIVNSIQMNH
tara:strand:- start:2215 stop:2607 length:393 start_codon:yes stop_codon:yes gene_type:complete